MLNEQGNQNLRNDQYGGEFPRVFLSCISVFRH